MDKCRVKIKHKVAIPQLGFEPPVAEVQNHRNTK
jgi:hypothetical protein